MIFKDLLNRLENGETMEQITDGTMVECVGNEVYEDDDLYTFLCSIGAKIEGVALNQALISTNDEKYYTVPCEYRENRFGKDLPDETILFFDYKRIHDVTEKQKINTIEA